MLGNKYWTHFDWKIYHKVILNNFLYILDLFSQS